MTVSRGPTPATCTSRLTPLGNAWGNCLLEAAASRDY